MIALYEGSTDITQYLERDTIRIREGLGNQRNSAEFGVLQHKIQQGSSIYMFDAFELTQEAASGQDTLHVLDTFKECDKFRVGDRVVAPVGSGVRRKYTILDIDHVAKTVQLSSNLEETIARGGLVGKIRFGGIMIKAPEAELGTTGTFEYSCSAVDWGNLFDRQIVVDTFTNQYAREIFGRIVYVSCANDSQITLEGFESAWTEGSVALAMANEATDRIEGTNAQKTGTSGAGAATWTKTISSTDLTAYDHVRWWWKVKASFGASVSAMKIRLGQDASNYQEYDLANIGEAFEDCWNYESVELPNYSSVTGTPDMAAVTWVQLTCTCTGAIPTGNIIFDHMLASTGGFTIQHVARGDTKFDEYRASYKKPTVVADDIAKKHGLFQYIDYERDIHLIKREDEEAPFQLTDTSLNYSNLVITPDMTKIVNRQTVHGGEAPSEAFFVEDFVADGQQTTFRLSYKPKDLEVYIDVTGVGDAYAEKSVGVENLVDETAYDFVFSFNEKTVRNADLAKLSQGDLIRFRYRAYKPIRKRVINYVSVERMKALTGGNGFYDGAPIVDDSIKTFEDAGLRGEIETDTYGNPLITAEFHTEHDGLHAGMIMRIMDSSRGIDEGYLIQSITAKAKNNDRFVYDVTCGSTLFGLIQFMQWLIKKNTETDSDSAELVDVVINQDETIRLDFDHEFTHANKLAKAGTRRNKVWDFVSNVGVAEATGVIGEGMSGTGYYALFSGGETGEAGFDGSNHNNDAELYLTTDVGGSGKSLVVRHIIRFPLQPNTEYRAQVWLELQAALTNVGTGGGVKMYLKEFENIDDAEADALQTDTVVTALTAAQDFTRHELVFTSHADAAFATFYVEIYQAIGTVHVADVKLFDGTPEPLAVPFIASFSEVS